MERVFGVLFKQFGVMYLLGRLRCSDKMSTIAKASFISHNMKVKERRKAFVVDGIDGVQREELKIDE